MCIFKVPKWQKQAPKHVVLRGFTLLQTIDSFHFVLVLKVILSPIIGLINLFYMFKACTVDPRVGDSVAVAAVGDRGRLEAPFQNTQCAQICDVCSS